MRVLQVNNYHRIVGGSDAVYFNTGQLLERNGHEVSWFAGADDGNLPCKDSEFFPVALNMDEARVGDLFRYMHNSDAALAIERLQQARGPFDLAHLHIYYGRLTASILEPLKKRGVPIVQSLHEYKLACPIYTLERDGAVCEKCVTGSSLNVLRHRCKGSLPRSIVAFAEYHASRWQGDVSKIDRFICVSGFQRQILLRYGIPEDKLEVLHNFVEPHKLKPERAAVRDDYLLYFGRIEKLKGVDTLLQAVGKSGARLLIAGTGSWTEELKAKIADLPNVEYLGFISGEPLKSLVAEARAVVVPSEWYENCPMSVIEAKAVGTPVIGARIGGIPELINDGIDGFLFAPGDVGDLVDKIGRIETADREAMSAACEADVAARFSPQTHLSRLLQIYADARSATKAVA